jgi:hypothetical protein
VWLRCAKRGMQLFLGHPRQSWVRFFKTHPVPLGFVA